MAEIQLQWEFSPKQTEIFESRSRFTVAMCGRRFGKNEVASLMAIDYATQPEKRPYGADDSAVVWWVGPTYNQTLKYGFEKVLEKVPPRIVDGEPKRSAPFQIDFWNGSRIEFYSFDRPSSLQGAGVDFMVVDEAAYMPESVWQNDLRPMLLDSRGGALLISKPMGENWFATRHEWGNDDSKPEWESVHATSYDNPWLDDAEIDAAKMTTPEQVFRQEYLADPQSGGTLLTLDMLDSDHAEVLNGRDWKWHIAVDLGVEMRRSKARENDTDYWHSPSWRKPQMSHSHTLPRFVGGVGSRPHRPRSGYGNPSVDTRRVGCTSSRCRRRRGSRRTYSTRASTRYL